MLAPLSTHVPASPLTTAVVLLLLVFPITPRISLAAVFVPAKVNERVKAAVSAAPGCRFSEGACGDAR